MSGSRRGIWGKAAALVAAYALVLQALIGTFAFAATPADLVGTVICTHDGAQGGSAGDDGRDRGADHRPSCCAAGCAFSASALGPAPDAIFRLGPAFAGTVAAAVPDAGRPLFSRHRWQANPRAPPAA